MSVTIDASVWIAAADPTDGFHQDSRSFLRAVTAKQIKVTLPSYALVEVSCSLARRLRNSAKGRRLARGIMHPTMAQSFAIDDGLLNETEQTGTDLFLRAADALYAAVALISNSTLVSWDNEHINRAGGLTPTSWLLANP
jgi:predicted nucleic acid-binding protein